MSNQKLEILQHSLGVDQYGRGQMYRNYFCASEDHSDYETCQQLVADGLMIRSNARSELTGGAYVFQVTQRGIDWMKANSPKPPKLTRAQKRYRQWLKADCGLTFGEWLKAS